MKRIFRNSGTLIPSILLEKKLFASEESRPGLVISENSGDRRRPFDKLSQQPGTFDTLLELLRPVIAKQDTNYRPAISAHDRLAMTIRLWFHHSTTAHHEHCNNVAWARAWQTKRCAAQDDEHLVGFLRLALDQYVRARSSSGGLSKIQGRGLLNSLYMGAVAGARSWTRPTWCGPRGSWPDPGPRELRPILLGSPQCLTQRHCTR
ncbi:hypothetical protein HPB52_005750 [Rhipicephalus sanguineus]|uniref:Uncharacterized protein n=1 Tax=Rhipicephalus sanguineus TaxID=34632 RepID=A0A9D4PX61_RHISA|nr:hypothetical protein HPB52_005750 [Rhipicephalus sanguineus]